MSSAKNHAKRSHRSEHFKRDIFISNHRKVVIRANQPKRGKKAGLFYKIQQIMRRKKVEASK